MYWARYDCVLLSNNNIVWWQTYLQYHRTGFNYVVFIVVLTLFKLTCEFNIYVYCQWDHGLLIMRNLIMAFYKH